MHLDALGEARIFIRVIADCQQVRIAQGVHIAREPRYFKFSQDMGVLGVRQVNGEEGVCLPKGYNIGAVTDEAYGADVFIEGEAGELAMQFQGGIFLFKDAEDIFLWGGGSPPGGGGGGSDAQEGFVLIHGEGVEHAAFDDTAGDISGGSVLEGKFMDNGDLVLVVPILEPGGIGGVPVGDSDIGVVFGDEDFAGIAEDGSGFEGGILGQVHLGDGELCDTIRPGVNEDVVAGA